jgi:hypothetical protein
LSGIFAQAAPWLIAGGLGVIFGFLDHAAQEHIKTSQVTGFWPIIALTVVGAMFNPDTTKPTTVNTKLGRVAWGILVGVAAFSTAWCAFFMLKGGYGPAQESFVVAAGGLAGLITNTSAFAVLESMLPAARGLGPQ